MRGGCHKTPSFNPVGGGQGVVVGVLPTSNNIELQGGPLPPSGGHFPHKTLFRSLAPRAPDPHQRARGVLAGAVPCGRGRAYR